ncbi:hypothetical protein EUTSA_v10017720mg, partial [Eutrema salsugineum]
KESKWNHRKSLAWDTAFFTNPGVLDHEELFGSLKIGENEFVVEVNHKQSIKTLPCVYSEIAARPSFAWDNAFFTDPGVLDAEELSLVNNGFTNYTQLHKSDDSMPTTTQGSRFSVASIEFDLFHDLRASLCNSPNVKHTETQKIKRKLPDGKKRTKVCIQKHQPLISLIPQPKVSSSTSSSSISKVLTPRQAKPEKKCVKSELERNKGIIRKNHGFEEHSGSKSILRSSYSGYAMKDLTSSSSGLRLPLPKMRFFDSNNGEKENREPNAPEATDVNRRRRHKSKLENSAPPKNHSVLGQRKTRK